MDNQTKSQIKDAKLRCSINSHWCIVWCIVWEYEMSRYYLNENNTFEDGNIVMFSTAEYAQNYLNALKDACYE